MFYEDNDLISLFNIRDNNKILEELNKGLSKGSAFIDDYQPYQNFQTYGIKATDAKDNLLLKIYELSFFINDLNLYLDIHHDDVIYQKFREYINIYQALVDDYEKLYGPLEVTASDYPKYEWLNNWPWEVNNV